MKEVNDVLWHVKNSNITETNNLVRTAVVVSIHNLGISGKAGRIRGEPFWKRRLVGQITQLRRDIRKLERLEKQQETRIRGLSQIEHKHRVKGKGVSVTEALLIAVGNEEDRTMLVRPLRHSESRIIIERLNECRGKVLENRGF